MFNLLKMLDIFSHCELYVAGFKLTVCFQVAEEDVAPAKKEKTHFTVKLTELKAEDKVKLIKEVKNCIQGLNLVQVRPSRRISN